MGEKLFISAERFHRDSLILAKKIKDTGYRPSFIVALWRGGTFPGCVVQEYLDYFGIKTDHIAIRTSSRNPDGSSKPEVSIHGLSYVLERATDKDAILLVDDIFDKGRTMEAVVKALSSKFSPKNIRIATVYYKPDANLTQLYPDYFTQIVDKELWINLPHELQGLTKEDIKHIGLSEFFD